MTVYGLPPPPRSRCRKGSSRDHEETHLVGSDEKEPIDQDRPNKDVGEDPGNETVFVRHHDSAIPIYSHESPCQRARHHGGVDEARIGMVAESQG